MTSKQGAITFTGLAPMTSTELRAMIEAKDRMVREQFMRDRPKADLGPIPGVTMIGLGQKARHGKNHAANVIHRAYPEDTMCFALADALKAHCRVQWGMTDKDAPMLQRVGTEMRERDPLVWIRALHWQIAEKAPRVALITDVRMRNEADWINQMGGTLIRVTRIDGGVAYVDPSRDPQHISEVDLDGYVFGYELTNHGDDRFDTDVLALYERIMVAQ